MIDSADPLLVVAAVAVVVVLVVVVGTVVIIIAVSKQQSEGRSIMTCSGSIGTGCCRKCSTLTSTCRKRSTLYYEIPARHHCTTAAGSIISGIGGALEYC